MSYTHQKGLSLTSADGLAFGDKGAESKLIDGSTGAATFPSTQDVAGNFSVATNKFTVAAATGNTVVAGTLTAGSNLIPTTFATSTTVQGANAATAANYGVFFIAPFACTVVSVREAHTAAGTDAGAVSLDIEKLTGTQAPDAGVAVLGATKIDLKGAANTVQAPALTATAADKVLAAGDRLCLKDTGVLTAVAGVAVTVELKAS